MTALRTVRTEFPNDLRVLYRSPGGAPARPRDRHPAFYGSFDWHSAVEMHWVLVRLLRLLPAEVPASQIRTVLDEHVTAEGIRAQTAYSAATPGMQRPYGWGWALTLHEEAASWPDGARWAAALQPLADHFLARRHAEPELAEVSGSDYMVEHWLAAYAVLYLDQAY